MQRENKHKLVQKIIIFGILILVVFFTAKLFYSYENIKISMIKDIKKEAKEMRNYALATKTVYQDIFLKNSNFLNEHSLSFLPAVTFLAITKEFKKLNDYEYEIKNVSINPRNTLNKADVHEAKAISFFKQNDKALEYLKEYLDGTQTFYQYASPLYIKDSCLNCHGKKEDTLEIIQNNYNSGYGAKIGDLQGILSIKISSKFYKEELSKFIYKEIIFSLISIIIISLILYILYKTTLQEIVKIDNNANEYAYTDALTGLYNRHYLSHLIDTFHVFAREDSRFGVAFIDIDYFKQINDDYGHIAGDTVLKTIGSTLKSHMRENDTVCRYGGEEFLIIMREISKENAYTKIDRIKIAISKIKFEDIKTKITISAGISVGDEDDEINNIIEEADKALYLAKESGRDCVKCFATSQTPRCEA